MVNFLPPGPPGQWAKARQASQVEFVRSFVSRRRCRRPLSVRPSPAVRPRLSHRRRLSFVCPSRRLTNY